MGTPFQTIFRTGASEVRMMGQMSFDAITIGNHIATAYCDSIPLVVLTGQVPRQPKDIAHLLEDL